MPRPKSVHLTERYTQEWVDKLVYPEFPKPFQPFVEGTSSAYYGLFDSVLTEKPYPIRTIIAPGTQALGKHAGVKEGCRGPEETGVLCGGRRGANCRHALCGYRASLLATPYEIDHPFEVRGNWIMARNRVIQPLGDYKSIFEFLCDLGVKMGYGADFWGGSMTGVDERSVETSWNDH